MTAIAAISVFSLAITAMATIAACRYMYISEMSNKDEEYANVVDGYSIRSRMHDMPFIHAVYERNRPLVKRMIGQGANIHALLPSGESLMSYALLQNDIELMKILRDAGADINEIDTRGDSFLIQSVKLRNLQAVRALILAGADCNVRDHFGYTPMHLAELHYSNSTDNAQREVFKKIKSELELAMK